MRNRICLVVMVAACLCMATWLLLSETRSRSVLHSRSPLYGGVRGRHVQRGASGPRYEVILPRFAYLRHTAHALRAVASLGLGPGKNGSDEIRTSDVVQRMFFDRLRAGMLNSVTELPNTRDIS